VTALQAVDALSGGPLRLPPRGLVRWTCDGLLVPGVRGADLGLEIARRMRAGRGSGAGVECGGPGIEALPLGDRVAMAHALVAAGIAHVLLPSDGRTRDAMRAWGRDSDWRELRFEAGAEGGAVAESLDLVSLEPLVAPWSDPGFARPLRQSIGRPIRGVLLGPFADESEFAILAAMLEGGTIAEGLRVVVIPGTDMLRDALDRSGVLARLREAGVRVPEPGAPWTPPLADVEGTWLACGAGAALRARLGERLWAANVEVCGASARAGTVADPRAVGLAATEPTERLAGSPRALAAATPLESAARVEPARALVDPPPRGALRGIVWAEVGDVVSAEDVLPRGARARKRIEDAEPGALFASRLGAWDGAGATGNGVMTAGRRFGGGPRADEAAWALRRAGVRAVLARSFAPDAVRALVYAGVLPLESTRRPLARLARGGEEIEVPSLPEAVEPGHSVGVRNLTRGVQDALTHGLDAGLVDIWRRGGLLSEEASDVR
jgi:aconitate hydratase